MICFPCYVRLHSCLGVDEFLSKLSCLVLSTSASSASCPPLWSEERAATIFNCVQRSRGPRFDINPILTETRTRITCGKYAMSEFCFDHATRIHDCFFSVLRRIFGCLAHRASTRASVRFVLEAIVSVLRNPLGALAEVIFRKLIMALVSFLFLCARHINLVVPIITTTPMPEIKSLLKIKSINM